MGNAGHLFDRLRRMRLRDASGNAKQDASAESVPFDEKDRKNGLVSHCRSRFGLSTTGSWGGQMTGPAASSQASSAAGPENKEKL
ncbi:MAG: hypothetical protein DRQ63_13325 [Gammaproteobacteria bacterium]|nr:MAG: hypothetical protein DRQ63_13325 [Gammaproteobacteria bacterium]